MAISFRERWIAWPLAAAACLMLSKSVVAGEDDEDKPKPPAKGEKPKPAPTKGTLMDYGPFLSYTVMYGEKPKRFVPKGISIKLADGQAGYCFDTDLMRGAIMWSGGFLDLTKTNIGALKGDDPAPLAGKERVTTAEVPGWSKDGKFLDPRKDAIGPLPKDRAHYKGLFVNGRQTIFSYIAEGCDVLESAGSVAADGEIAFTRTINAGASKDPLYVLVADVAGATGVTHGNPSVATMASSARTVCAAVVGAPEATIELLENSTRAVVKVAPHAAPIRFTIVAWGSEKAGDKAAEAKFPKLVQAAGAPADLAALCKGGAPLWGGAIQTAGSVATESGSYVLDTIALPESNPAQAWMRLSGIDFFADGRAAVSTLNGDVWIVSGIDDKLQNVSWTRFATGMYEPLGIKVVDGDIYVLGRDQITKLHDLNHDGMADRYENFNNDRAVFPSYHTFAFDLHTDSKGDFYYIVGGNQCPPDYPWHNCLLKISKDGSTAEVHSTGYRAPNGMAIGPNDEIVCSDNQGHWTPASKINWVKKGGFYGFISDPRRVAKGAPAAKFVPDHFDPPLCWVPYGLDNSSGGQVFVTNNKFGPLKGHILHFSYGKCAILDVLSQEVNGVKQAAVLKLPLDVAGGVMRGRFSPTDGQLYTVGLRGWQTRAAKDGVIQRVRYTGAPHIMPTSFNLTADGIRFGFDVPLDPETANDPENYGVEMWNYKWSSGYGSPDVPVDYTTAEGKLRNTVEVTSAKIGEDGKSVTLKLKGLRQVMQMSTKLKIKTKDGKAISTEVSNTVNQVPK